MARKKIKKLLTPNWIIEYNNKIQSGEIVAGKKIKAIYKRLAREVNECVDDRWIFCKEEADKAIEFIETFCYATRGEFAKCKLKLMLWQKAMLSAIYGFVDKNDKEIRRYNEVFLVMGRKNGKTSVGSAISQYELTREFSGEIYCVGSTYAQASILFNDLITSISLCPEMKSLSKKTKTNYSFKPTNSFIRPLPGDAQSLDGLNASLCVEDEVHSYKDTSLYAIIKQSMQARKSPLLMQISTGGFILEDTAQYNVFYNLSKQVIEDENTPMRRFLPLVYEIDEVKDIDEEKNWIKANPSLYVVKKIEDMRENVEKMKMAPALKQTVLTKDFNLLCNSATSFFDFEDVQVDPNEILAGVLEGKIYNTYGVCSFDLSNGGSDMSSASILVKKEGKMYCLNKCWIPASKYQMYKDWNLPIDIWIENGFMALSGTTAVEYQDIEQWIYDTCDKYSITCTLCGYDRYCSTYLVKNLEDRGIICDAAPYTTPGMSPLLYELRALLQDHRFIYNSPILKWCLLNCEVLTDTKLQVYPKKNVLKKKIDAMMATLYGFYAFRNHPEYENYLNN